MTLGKGLRYAVCILCLILPAGTPHASQSAEVFEDGKYRRKECMSFSDLKKVSPTREIKLSPYGGWMAKRAEATGFFHVGKFDDRWWIVDPDGCFFLSIGINSVNLPDRREEEPPNQEDLRWGADTMEDLRSLGFNTLGCWSDAEIVRKLKNPMPYCLRWNFMANYRKIRRNKYPATDQYPVIYPFDPEYEAFCDRHARQTKETKDDPWLFGHFSDNELPLREKGIVKLYLSHPKNDPNHLAAAAFLQERGRNEPSKEDDRDFQRLVVETHYRKVAAALRRHDPHHMYLGTRFHGLALNSPAVFEAAGQYADLISVNYYHRWTPEKERIEKWAELAQKPILISEYYAMAADVGLPTSSFGAGFPVRAQRDRAKFYEHFGIGLLQIKACVGWHWFKYRDGKNNAGIVDPSEKPHSVLTQAMKNLNLRAYAIID